MPVDEFRCDECGLFEKWLAIAECSNPATCPSCEQFAKRIFSPPAVLSGSLRLKTENSAPQLVKRDKEPEVPKFRNHAGSRPWTIGH